jgi:1-acyl-sn-glycerol-3-phosphate acyltransferase
LDTDGKKNLAFNDKLRQELAQLVFEISSTDIERKKELLIVKQNYVLKVVLAIPALIGVLFNAPLYLPVRHFAQTKAKDTDHYDSVLLALLIFLYPFYLLLITALFFFWLTCSWVSFAVLLIFPFTAWALVQVKGQLDK